MNERAYKAKASTEYTRRINKALEFIHQNLDQPIRLDDVAGASCFSAFHFHRIFHALVGETVNDYVSRKRMERAVSRLVRKPGLSVTDVAVAGGFSSSANFFKGI
jgi:AraC family transcriptional regulator